MHRLNHQWLTPLGPGKCFFGRFLLRLSMTERPQVMSMVKFSPTTLNFDYEFVLSVHFFWDTLDVKDICHKDTLLDFYFRNSGGVHTLQNQIASQFATS